MRVTREEKVLGDLFAEKAGIKPLLNQLLKIDGMAAKRFMFVGRRMLWINLMPPEQVESKKSKKQKILTAHDIVAGVNKSIDRFGNYNFEPKKEEDFAAYVNAIINTSLMFLFQNVELKEGEKDDAIKEINMTIDALSLVFSELADNVSFEEARKLILLSLPKEKKSRKAKTKPADQIDDSISDDYDKGVEENLGEVPPEENEELLLTRKETRELLKISETTLWRREKKGIIPKAIRNGGTVRYRKSDIMKLLEE